MTFKILAIATLSICTLASKPLADTLQIRVSVGAQGDNGDDARMVSALSREFRKLDGVLVTDTQPVLRITCVVVRLNHSGGKTPAAFAASVAAAGSDDRLITHLVQTASSIDILAHEIAITFDGAVIERMRRAAQPSSSRQRLQQTSPAGQMALFPLISHAVD
jgi:hypothetical protein